MSIVEIVGIIAIAHITYLIIKLIKAIIKLIKAIIERQKPENILIKKNKQINSLNNLVLTEQAKGENADKILIAKTQVAIEKLKNK